MSQVSDVSIANQGFSAFRTELNNIIGALNTTHLGSSAPASLAQGSLWIDTSAGATGWVLKLYDGAGHISLGTINSTANTVDWTDSSISLADDSVTLAKMASGTDGNIISYDASGNPVAVATGSDGQVLTSTGAGSPPAFESTISFKEAGTNFPNSLLIGHSTTGTLDDAQRNLGVGIGTLDAITSGDRNIAIGYNAGSAITTALYNTFVGDSSGVTNISGASNTGIGMSALGAVSSGHRNTAVGYNCANAMTASDTTAIGYEALKDATGINNTAIGKDAGIAVVGGTYNIMVGFDAGDNVTSGSGNVIIGSVDAGSATGSRQLVIAGNDGSTSTTWLSGSSAGVVSFSAANVTQQALTSSSNAVAWDASAKPNAVHITTENTTFSAPSNAIEGAFICLEINYNGSHTIGWNTVFEFAASTEPTTTDTDAKTDIFVFRYNGAIWQEVGRTLNLSES